MKKDIKVFALPTEKASLFGIAQNTGKWWLRSADWIKCEADISFINGKYHHLYATTDEQPKKNEWYIHSGIEHNYPNKKYHNLYRCNNGVHTHDNYDSLINPLFSRDTLFIDGFFAKDCRKVVSTDDKELWMEAIAHSIDSGFKAKIPLISPEFQQAWVKAANEGKPIVDALMEFEQKPCMEERCLIHTCDGKCYVPKINDKGYVTILPKVEKMYNREEVIKDIDWEQVFDNAQSMHRLEFISYYKEQNL